jgi:hypothetical protein
MWKKITYRNYFLASIIINIGVALLLILLKSYIPPMTPLFYGKPVGEAQLTYYPGLFIAPGVSLLIALINLFLSFLIKDDFLRKTLAISGIIVSGWFLLK